MKLPRLRSLDQSGFHLHFILPVLAIVAVAGIGSYLINASNAATLPQTCRGYTFTTSGTNKPASVHIVTAVCVQYVQQMLNGSYALANNAAVAKAHNLTNYRTAVAQYNKYAGVASGSIQTDGKFGAATKTRVQAFQASFQYYNGTSKKYVDLSPDGSVGANTWSALCGLTLRIPRLDTNYKNNATELNAYNVSRKAVAGCAVSAAPSTGVSVHAHVPAGVTNPAPKVAGGTGGSGGSGGGVTTPQSSCRVDGSPATGGRIICTLSNGTVFYQSGTLPKYTSSTPGTSAACSTIYEAYLAAYNQAYTKQGQAAHDLNVIIDYDYANCHG